MSFRGDPQQKRRRYGVTLWFLVATILLVFLFKHVTAIEKEAEQASVQLSVKRMEHKANLIKQLWMVSKQPLEMEFEGQSLVFSELGWPMILNQGQLDCQGWLTLLNGSEHIYASVSETIESPNRAGIEACHYRLPSNKVLSLQMENEQLAIYLD